MAGFQFPRSFFIPAGATKVADKRSDAVAYVYANAAGKLCAVLFVGKQAKPVWHHSFKTEALREASVRRGFEQRRATFIRKAEYAAECQASAAVFAATIEAGDIFYTRWGYDQTNIDWYEITGVKGRMVRARRIRAAAESLGYDDRFRAVPQSGDFAGPETRHLIQGGYIKFDGHSGNKWNTKRVAGVPVGEPVCGGGMH